MRSCSSPASSSFHCTWSSSTWWPSRWGRSRSAPERDQWPKAIHDALTFGPNQEGGIFPTLLIDFGLRPSIGAHVFWGFLPVHNRISLDAAWGGAQWWTVAFADRQEFGRDESLVTELRWDRRRTTRSTASGPRPPAPPVAGRNRRAPGLAAWKRVLGQVTLRAGGSVRRLDYKDFTCCGDPALKQRVERGEVPPPPGYEEPYTAAGGEVAAVLDTRRGTARTRAAGEWRSVAPRPWICRGADASPGSATPPVSRETGTSPGTPGSSASECVTAFVDPLGSEPVPFTELVMLGGNEPFAGYIQGRLRDRSAIVAQLGWHWPVFSYLDGLLAVSVGNVFGPHLEEFRFNLLRLSAETRAPDPRRELQRIRVRHRDGDRALPELQRLLVPVVLRSQLWPVGTSSPRWPSPPAPQHRAHSGIRPCSGATTTGAPSRRSPSTTARRWRGPVRRRRSSGRSATPFS